jgi:hypothetical protein
VPHVAEDVHPRSQAPLRQRPFVPHWLSNWQTGAWGVPTVSHMQAPPSTEPPAEPAEPAEPAAPLETPPSACAPPPPEALPAPVVPAPPVLPEPPVPVTLPVPPTLPAPVRPPAPPVPRDVSAVPALPLFAGVGEGHDGSFPVVS